MNKQDERDSALAAVLGMQEKQGEVGHRPRPDETAPERKIRQYRSDVSEELKYALGWQFDAFMRSAAGSEIYERLCSLVEDAYADGVRHADMEAVKHESRRAQAGTAVLLGLLNGLPGDL